MVETTPTLADESVRPVPPPEPDQGTDVKKTEDAAPPKPAPRLNGGPSDPESMRAEIERTRARMSDTLDEIEDRLLEGKRELVRKKDELWAKATLKGVRRTITTEPWRSVAIAFVAGYIVAAIRD